MTPNANLVPLLESRMNFPSTPLPTEQGQTPFSQRFSSIIPDKEAIKRRDNNTKDDEKSCWCHCQCSTTETPKKEEEKKKLSGGAIAESCLGQWRELHLCGFGSVWAA